ncbi:hypothetical protein KPZU09_23160 [Klebsiella pneumoniae]|uniref:Lipoprotein n=1 Tax=Klebsiella pneumoniae TaxID=573 RepID=A0A919HQU0_KLEPN|nr:hypothetical protein KPZU09_23160 [Klebsiella pneumoniae]
MLEKLPLRYVVRWPVTANLPVSAQQLAVAKQQLGLSPQDSLGSRSKAMGIARNVGAQYVLYSNATGNVNAPELKMQLMLVQTGEIIWSGKGAVQQQ